MGFFNSLKGQVGRDSGRVVSSFVFGSKHATKYQRIDNDNSKNIKSNLKYQRDYELDILAQEKENNRLEFEKEKINNANLFVENNVAKILSIKVPQKKDEIIENIQNLAILIAANPWKNVELDENKITNNYTDVVLKKYEQHLFILKNKFRNDSETIYFENQFNQYKKESFKGKYKAIVFYVICFIAIISFMLIMSHYEDKS